MKQYTIDQIKNENIAVICNNKEESDEFYKMCNTGNHHDRDEPTVNSVDLQRDGKYWGGYTINNEEGRNWYIKNGYTIINFSQIEQEQNTMKEVAYYKVIKLVPLTKWEIGHKLTDQAKFPKYEQYPEFFSPIFEEQFKEGDYIVILYSGNRYTTHSGIARELKCDASYYYNVPDTKMVKFLRYATFDDGTNVFLGEDNGYYYAFGVKKETEDKYYRKATAAEIKQYKQMQNIKFGEYKLEIVDNKAKFGCKSFSKQTLIEMLQLYDSEVEGTLTIKGINVTAKTLNSIISQLK
jgi:hypothetical protein